jgi:ribosomal protein S18 acetylase RimI-like enzyme
MQDISMIAFVPMSQAAFEAFVARSTTNYAEEVSKANDIPLEEATAQAEASFRRLLPDGRPDQADQHLYVVVDEEGQEVGTIWWGVRRDRPAPYAYVWDLYLDPAFRGKGHGERVMRRVEEQARALGLERLALNVFGHNAPARKLYERLGFRTISLGMDKVL